MIGIDPTPVANPDGSTSPGQTRARLSYGDGAPFQAASGRRWQENLVAGGFLSVGVVIVTSSLLTLWGLRTKA